ncbi:NUDIX hydrolase [Legionella nagasakiensis]|uniref:NUDIX hydrolase n=1 Tax=Legionella nagasakiensis TaxID=535290 RepID=UPI001055C6F1|nr:NUDIX hydrolase [Legionella nagasakiensis]
MTIQNDQWLKWISEIQAISQTGLAYTENDFDKQRYLRLGEIVTELATHCADKSLEDIQRIFSLQKGYATPKIDVRAFILKNNKLLLVKEKADGLWALPGGWADVNESPSEVAVRETREETGFEVSAKRLLALWDKLKHDHPLQWPHTYKCFFYCEIISGEAKENLEISEIDFFNINDLPSLSTPRVTANQLCRLYDLACHTQSTDFD